MKKIFLLTSAIFCCSLSTVAYADQKTPCFQKEVNLAVDGQSYFLNAYTINDYTYFKLRDIAYVMKASSAPFSVNWNEQIRSIQIFSNVKDTAISAPTKGSFSDERVDALPNAYDVYIDQKKVSFETYNLYGNTYFKLRDLGNALQFDVDWNSMSRQISISTKKENAPISPLAYQKMLGKGMDVDWSKTKGGQQYYNTKAVEDFAAAGISHVRIRVSEDISDALLQGLDRQISDCLSNGIIPIIAYQADSFKNNPNNKNMKKVVEWWDTVAQRYQNYPFTLSFDLLIEATDALNQKPEKLNELYEQVTTKIRESNPERIIIISPRLRSDPAYLSELKIPTDHNGYLMAEWHFYAAGPSKTNEKKLWTTGSPAEKKLIQDKIDTALAWQRKTGIPTWVGAWMAGDYNDGNHYTVAEQVTFATFVCNALDNAGIPYAVNSDTKFYNRETNEWYEEMLPLRNTIYRK